MKTKLFTLSLVLAASLGPIFADKVQIGDLYYNLNEENKIAEVTSTPSEGDGYSGDIIIPSNVEYNNTTYSVTNIGDDAFYNCTGLTSIEIPNSVKNIGDGAFYECTGLISVTLGNGLTSTGVYVFARCYALKSIEIPNSITSIDLNAFGGSGLTSITIPNSVTSIWDNAFGYCDALSSVIIGNSVTDIHDDAFEYCGALTSVVSLAIIPPTVQKYGFYGVDCSQIPLYVPAESIEAYKAADVWKDFNPILEYKGTEGLYLLENSNNSQKLIREGNVYILRGDHTYTLTGQEVK